MKKIFSTNLEDTRLGNIIFYWLFPIIIMCYGFKGIITKEITLKNFTYTGFNAQVMGLAVVLLTIAIFRGDYIALKLGKQFYSTILFFISLGLVLYATYNSYLLLK